MNKKIMKLAGFKKQVDSVEAGECPICTQPIRIEDFRDKRSVDEFHISGLCQRCQDEVF